VTYHSYDNELKRVARLGTNQKQALNPLTQYRKAKPLNPTWQAQWRLIKSISVYGASRVVTSQVTKDRNSPNREHRSMHVGNLFQRIGTLSSIVTSNLENPLPS
jgi:hypothetical protein